MEGQNLKTGDDPYRGLLHQFSKSRPKRNSGTNFWRRQPGIKAAIEAEALQKLGARGGDKKKELASMQESIAKGMYEALSQEEKKRWKQLANEHHAEAVANWEKEKNGPSGNDPASRQKAIYALAEFIQPVLDGICQATGWKCTLIAGGPEPAHGGQLNILSFHSGTTLGNVRMNFGQAEHVRYDEQVVGIFSDFLAKCYSLDECRVSASPQEEQSEPGCSSAPPGHVPSSTAQRPASASKGDIEYMPVLQGISASAIAVAPVQRSPRTSTGSDNGQTTAEKQPAALNTTPSTSSSPHGFAAQSPLTCPPGPSESPGPTIPNSSPVCLSRSPVSSGGTSSKPLSWPLPQSSPQFSLKSRNMSPSKSPRLSPKLLSPSMSQLPLHLPTTVCSHLTYSEGVNCTCSTLRRISALQTSFSHDSGAAPATMSPIPSVVPSLDGSVYASSVASKRKSREGPDAMRDGKGEEPLTKRSRRFSANVKSQDGTNNGDLACQRRSLTLQRSSVTPQSCAPKWFLKSMELFRSSDLGDSWTSLLSNWAAFEESKSFDGKGLKYSSQRPLVVGIWITKHRSIVWRPDLKQLKGIDTDFNSWWSALQPEWRLVDGLLDYNLLDGDWSSVSWAGLNGIQSAIVALFYWGFSLEQVTMHSSREAWELAVSDCSQVLKRLGAI